MCRRQRVNFTVFSHFRCLGRTGAKKSPVRTFSGWCEYEPVKSGAEQTASLRPCQRLAAMVRFSRCVRAVALADNLDPI